MFINITVFPLEWSGYKKGHHYIVSFLCGIFTIWPFWIRLGGLLHICCSQQYLWIKWLVKETIHHRFLLWFNVKYKYFKSFQKCIYLSFYRMIWKNRHVRICLTLVWKEQMSKTKKTFIGAKIAHWKKRN